MKKTLIFDHVKDMPGCPFVYDVFARAWSLAFGTTSKRAMSGARRVEFTFNGYSVRIEPKKKEKDKRG